MPATATPAATGHWEAAGSLAVSRVAPHVVPLGAAGVLVVGNDDCGYSIPFDWSLSGPFSCSQSCIRSDSRTVEAWTAPDRWTKVGPLSAPRADMAVVALKDGRALVTGGVEATGTTDPDRPWLAQPRASLARTSVFDPATGHWTRVADLASRRTAPIAATLQDGRVLVAGGYDLDAAYRWPNPAGWRGSQAGIVLAAHRPGPGQGSGSLRVPLYNTVPAGVVPVLATAELYDPATNTWSSTGPLRVARFGDAAVTLADGRVLVVPDAFPPFDGWSRVWDWLGVEEHELALTVTEIYDPRTGRFGLAGELPPIDWTPLAALGYSVLESADVGTGSLVALEDGGALLVGRSTSWRGDGAEGSYVRSLRFDPSTNQWSEIDRSFWADVNSDGLMEHEVAGRTAPGTLAAPLADGRVLVAGGLRSLGDWDTPAVASESAAVYDSATGTWTDLPPLPEPRAGGAAVTLADGSVILVGGLVEQPTRHEDTPNCNSGPAGSSSTIRFVPNR